MDDVLSIVLAFQKDTDLNSRSEFIKSYTPFIIKCVSKTTGYYIHSENSDEYSIGLMAFNEAIDRYDSEKGSFVGYANIVIKSRVKDFMRKEWHYNQELDIDDQILLRQKVQIDEDLVAEIQSFKDRLLYFDIVMDDLADSGPKHKQTRQEVHILGQAVSLNDELSKKLYRTKKLPMAEIVIRYKSTKKRLKTYRNYIISIIIVFREKLEGIKSYLDIRGDRND